MQWQLLVACDMVWVASTLLGGDDWREQPGAGDGISPSYRHWVRLEQGWIWARSAAHLWRGLLGDSDSIGPLQLCQGHLPAWRGDVPADGLVWDELLVTGVTEWPLSVGASC